MPKTILIIEDNEDVVRILRDRLEVWGYHVLEAGTEEEGLKKLKQNQVVGIIFDLNIPVEVNLSALSRVHQSYPLIPIIVTTEETERVALIQALEQGASALMSRPIDFDLLLEKCLQLFG